MEYTDSSISSSFPWTSSTSSSSSSVDLVLILNHECILCEGLERGVLLDGLHACTLAKGIMHVAADKEGTHAHGTGYL